MKSVFSEPNSILNCLIASRKGCDSISPTVPPISTIAISESFAPHRIFNIGNGKPIKLIRFIEYLEEYLGVEAKKRFMEMQPGDVVSTHADTSKIKELIGEYEMTDFKNGIKKFVNWYKNFHFNKT